MDGSNCNTNKREMANKNNLMKRGSSRGCGGSGVVVVVVDGGTGDSCRKGCCARGGCCSYGIGGDVLGMFIINSHYIIITSCLWRIGLRYTIAPLSMVLAVEQNNWL